MLVRVSLTCQACSYHPARALVALDYPELRLPRGTCHVINEMRIMCIFDTPAQNRHLNEKQRSEAWDASVSDVARIHRSNEHNEIMMFFLLYITFHSSTIRTIVNNRCTYTYTCIYVEHQMFWRNRVHRLVPTQPKGFTSWSSVLRRMFRRDVGHRSHSQEDGKIDVAPRGSARAHTRTHDWKSSCSDCV